MEEIFTRVPLGSKLVLITDHVRLRITNEVVKDCTTVRSLSRRNYGNRGPCIRSSAWYPSRIMYEMKTEYNVGGNHYHRMVYLRMAEAIIEELKVTPPKTAELRRTAVVRRSHATRNVNEHAMNQSALGFAAIQTLAALLDDEDGRKIFTEAVFTAFLEKHASTNEHITSTMIGRLAAAIESHGYASQKMAGVPRFQHRNDLLNFACKNITVDGPSLEFGVWSGHSVNLIASLIPSSKVYGFDSFEGLPEAWFGKGDGIGQFSLNGELPEVRENVELVVGWFVYVLAPFLETHEFDKIALLHIDCDIYSSTQSVFSYLHKKIVPGTIIVFDEYFNYRTWQRHEYAAFQECVAYRQIKYEYFGLVPGDMQVAVRILSV